MHVIDKKNYDLAGAEAIYSPSLVYYYDIITENTKKIIKIAGGAEKLWPHIKTHKMLEMLKLQISLGIRRFKCATITELETAAKAGASDALLAYPLIGPNVARFLALCKKYPHVRLWAAGDDYGALSEISRAAQKEGLRVPLLLDVNVGMNRTGVKIGADTVTLYEKAAALPGLEVCGLHCYDGHVHDEDAAVRLQTVSAIYENIRKTRDEIRQKGLKLDVIIAGGTPAFPCHAKIADPDFYYSPGTIFVNDYGYYSRYQDLDMVPAAAIIARVISHPAPDLFTLDLGYKGISADPAGARGIIADFPDAKPVSQSEEHWVFQKSAAMQLPEVGTIVKVIPTHICPTSALYPFVRVVKNGKVAETWEVTARNRE